MFWNRTPKVAPVIPDPTWDDECTAHGNNVFTFPANRHLRSHTGSIVRSEPFAKNLARFLGTHPDLEVSAMAPKDSGGYTYTYVVVMKPKSA